MNKFKLKGKQLLKKIESESLTLKNFIDILNDWHIEDMKERKGNIPTEVIIQLYDEKEEKFYFGKLHSLHGEPGLLNLCGEIKRCEDAEIDG